MKSALLHIHSLFWLSKRKNRFSVNLLAMISVVFFYDGNVTDHFVRKLAHFIELAKLGAELMTLIAVRNRIKTQNIVNCLFAGLSTAVIDEAIQIFSGRGPQVQDVLLDFAGCCTGLLFAGLFVLLITVMKRHKKLAKQ